MLALIQGEPPSAGAGAVCFGCTLAQPEEVHRSRERLRQAGVRSVEWEDSDGHVDVGARDEVESLV
ncbi:MAG: hypothetical protein ACXW2C_11105 [Acidimicrobiia bacterium]